MFQHLYLFIICYLWLFDFFLFSSTPISLVLFYSLDACLFPNSNGRRCRSGEEGRWAGTGRDWVKEMVAKTHCMRKNNYFKVKQVVSSLCIRYPMLKQCCLLNIDNLCCSLLILVKWPYKILQL